LFSVAFLVMFVCQGLSAPLPLNEILALWYCGDDGCSWGEQPNLNNAKWILDRGDGKPVANVINIAFVDPLALLKRTNNSANLNGVPKGLTPTVVNYFWSKGIYVIASIGGASYVDKWNQALDSDPVQLAKNAALLANELNVGIEIDYEQDDGSRITALDTFIKTFRSIIPYDSNLSPKSLFTIDLGSGNDYLAALSKASIAWLSSKSLNWAYAMVDEAPYNSISQATANWQQHLTGGSGISPMPATDLIVSLYAEKPAKNCNSYDGTVQQGAVSWIQQKGTRGLAYWSVGCDGACVSNCTGIATTSKNLLKY